MGKWKNNLPRVAGQIKIHGSITDDLIKYGYENDGSWEEILEDVEPDLSESHWPEYFTSTGLKHRKRGKYKEVVKTIMRRAGIDTQVVTELKSMFRIITKW